MILAAAHSPADRSEQYRARGWWTGEALTDRFERLVTAAPDRLSVIDDRGVSLTRAQLWERAGAFARSLAAVGVGRGDVVVVYLPNTADWQVVFLGVLRLGAVPASVPMTTDAETLAHICELTSARAVVAPRRWRRHPVGEWACSALAATGRASAVGTLDDDGWHWRELRGAPHAPVVPEPVNHLMFTSSTTGLPKAVMHTADTLGSANRAFAERFALHEDTGIYMPSPLGHSVGAWHGARLSLYLGATLVLQDVWDPVRGLELVDTHRCAFTAAATPFLKDLVDADWSGPRAKLSSLKTFLCGGAPVPPVLLDQAREQAPNTFVTVLWGMTEGTGTTCTPDSTPEQLTGTAGKPVPDLELTILDRDDTGVGELAMRGPQVFVGYLGQDELYQSLLTEDGYFRTGDLARIGEDGYLRLAGRLKDLIIRGGVNISPVPIEDAIAAHSAVRRVAVIGQTDDRLGERIRAVIEPSGPPPTLEELNAWLTERGLSPRMLPESLVVVDDMPVTAAGKIRKVELRRMLEERR
ncbi:cyclohexanecarboxylate-CoA ligase/acyl-CoA synthetase [Pseudonocardia thermophila]|uniref:Cyclohexanecarboxylate-CoA ligase/acyl-CoA synthetase n=1 Tax=Pseudonocardia thermophila TaxID=1848 RepID=A0A1M6S1M6_PSETH|nr:cyclohexanecarboxylate-CoA ligase/acyl-CoA synthetase [Pseudonocardia thermophila]